MTLSRCTQKAIERVVAKELQVNSRIVTLSNTALLAEDQTMLGRKIDFEIWDVQFEVALLEDVFRYATKVCVYSTERVALCRYVERIR